LWRNPHLPRLPLGGEVVPPSLPARLLDRQTDVPTCRPNDRPPEWPTVQPTAWPPQRPAVRLAERPTIQPTERPPAWLMVRLPVRLPLLPPVRLPRRLPPRLPAQLPAGLAQRRKPTAVRPPPLEHSVVPHDYSLAFCLDSFLPLAAPSSAFSQSESGAWRWVRPSRSVGGLDCGQMSGKTLTR